MDGPDEQKLPKQGSGDKPAADQGPSAADVPPAPEKPLSAEEQMALYEEHLKETDWGHQPC